MYMNTGRGHPVFETEDECTYIFNWHTQYACVDDERGMMCAVSEGKKLFDLSLLAQSGMFFEIVL